MIFSSNIIKTPKRWSIEKRKKKRKCTKKEKKDEEEKEKLQEPL
jgi:hypothetical protein